MYLFSILVCAIHISVVTSNLEILKLFFRYGSPKEELHEDRQNLLLETACIYGHENILQFLLDKKLQEREKFWEWSYDSRNRSTGYLCLDMALKYNQRHLFPLLVTRKRVDGNLKIPIRNYTTLKTLKALVNTCQKNGVREKIRIGRFSEIFDQFHIRLWLENCAPNRENLYHDDDFENRQAPLA